MALKKTRTSLRTVLQFGGINIVEKHWDIIGEAPRDFEERSNRNGMKFNIAKCISMHLGTNNCHRQQ